MNVTVNHPGKMTVKPEQVVENSVMVYVDEGEQRRALLLWVAPETAAQWIEALTPIAAKAEAVA